jgi:Fe-Mn family superoxide dismutase
MPIELPNLPYPDEALEPFISARTLKTHHGKHHRAYVDKVNALVSGTNLSGETLKTIMKQSVAHATGNPAMTALFNNAAQVWNHTFYWSSLRPMGAGGPRDALAARIEPDFGDERRFTEAFKSAATAHFGSGWAWLVFDGRALKVVTTSNADTPIVHGQAPLLVIDVWEHAYYLDHQERRAAYVAGVVENLLNWDFAGRNFELATRRSGAVSPERNLTSQAAQ